jgi:hypothetical protein
MAVNLVELVAECLQYASLSCINSDAAAARDGFAGKSSRRSMSAAICSSLVTYCGELEYLVLFG